MGIRSKMALCFPALLALCAVGYVHIRPSMNTSFSHYRCHQSSPIDSDVFFDILVDRFGPTGRSTCRRRRFQETFKGDLRRFWAWMERCTQLGSMKVPLIKSFPIAGVLAPELSRTVGKAFGVRRIWEVGVWGRRRISSRYFPMTALSIITSVFILYWILKLPV